MKNIKRMLAVLLVLSMAITMAAGAFAAGGYTITIENPAHDYEIFQIFTGKPSTDGNTLSDVKWGQNGNFTPGAAGAGAKEGDKVAADKLQALVGETDASKLAAYADLAGTPIATIKAGDGTKTTEALAPGYYVVSDKDAALEGEFDSHTLYVVQLLHENLTIAPKAAKPTVDKQVLDAGDERDTWGETADHDINEEFQFKLIITLPNDANIDLYENYKVVLTDTLSAGITFDRIDSVKFDTSINLNGKYTAKEPALGDNTLTITIDDLKAIDGITSLQNKTVEVLYTAHLNEDAVIAGAGNPNDVYLEYSNNPNGDGMGKTPKDTVWVFTYELNNTKVEPNGEAGGTKPLAGVEFELYAVDQVNEETVLAAKKDELNTYMTNKVKFTGDNGAYTVDKDGTVTTLISAAGSGKFDIKGLDDGVYILKETKPLDGYNSIEPIVFEISAAHTEAGDALSANNTITYTRDNESATKNNEIINNKGVVLPETGGMGTTVFYVVGGILMIGAAVLLITKKRMNSHN